jgi:hypothetical protein
LTPPTLDEHGGDVKQLICSFVLAHLGCEPVSGHVRYQPLSNAGWGHYFTFKYELIARRTISASETFSRLAAAFKALICPASIKAINRW